MVAKVFTFMHREIRGLHQTAYILAMFTFGSQLLALIRDRLLAHQFGASIELDLYYTAFRIPDMLFVLFVSTLSVYVLIPFLTPKMADQTGREVQTCLSQIFSLFLILYSIVALAVCISAPYVVHTFFPGFDAHEDMLVVLIRILLLQPFFLGVSSLLGVITQIKQRFILYAIGPILYNVGIIAGLLFLYPVLGLPGLVWGVVVGACAHVCIQVPYIFRTPYLPYLTLRLDMPMLLSIFRLSFVRMFTLSLHQIVLLILIGFASLMTIGSVSVFQFAFNLQSVPLAIIGVSYSVAAFPVLTQLYAERRMDVFGGYIMDTLRHILFWSLPIIALFIVIRAQFVRVVLGSGAFDWNDTRLTSAVLALFILSLVAQAVHLLIVRALYAVGDTRTPFLVTVGSSLLTLASAYYFYLLFIYNNVFRLYMEGLMRLEGVGGVEVLALPLGYSLALMLHSIVLLVWARKKTRIALQSLIRPCAQSVFSAICAGYVAYGTLNYFVALFTIDTLMSVFAQGAIAGCAGLFTYVCVQYALRNRELQEIMGLGKKQTSAPNVMAPQGEDYLSV